LFLQHAVQPPGDPHDQRCKDGGQHIRGDEARTNCNGRPQEEGDQPPAQLHGKRCEQTVKQRQQHLTVQTLPWEAPEEGQHRQRGKAAADQREERLASAASMEGRKILLAAKQDMVGKAFDLAMDKLCNLPEDEYVKLLAELAVKASSTGREQVVLSQKDRARVGKAVVTAANEMLAKQVAPKLPDELTETRPGALLEKVVNGASALLSGTGMLTLSERTASIRGGLILADGAVEVNCSFEALISQIQNQMAGEVAKVLFE